MNKPWRLFVTLTRLVPDYTPSLLMDLTANDPTISTSSPPNPRCSRCSDRVSDRHCFCWVTPSGTCPACPASENDRAIGTASGSAIVANGSESGTCCPWIWSGCASDAPTWNVIASGMHRASPPIGIGIAIEIWIWSPVSANESGIFPAIWMPSWTWRRFATWSGCARNGAIGNGNENDGANETVIGCWTIGNVRGRCDRHCGSHGPQPGGCGDRSARYRPVYRWPFSCRSWWRIPPLLRSCAACGHRRRSLLRLDACSLSGPAS